MTQPELPFIIAAPDYRKADDIKALMQKLRLIGQQDLGVKIPNWHNQNQDLIRMFIDQGRYVVLETQIHNTPPKMRTATEAFLSQTVLPSAITVNPVQQITTEGERALRVHVVNPAHSAGVQVIGYAEHGDLVHTDDHFMEREASRYERGAGVKFDAFEVHASTVGSSFFAKAHQRITGNPKLAAPRVIASKLVEGKSNSTEIVLKVVEMIDDGVDSIYLGESLMGTPDPARLINTILDKL
jgi:hypothetical protein